MGGTEMRMGEVDRNRGQLDPQMAMWRTRTLHRIAFSYLILDSPYCMIWAQRP